jgi:hypothetical protein
MFISTGHRSTLDNLSVEIMLCLNLRGLYHKLFTVVMNSVTKSAIKFVTFRHILVKYLQIK